MLEAISARIFAVRRLHEEKVKRSRFPTLKALLDLAGKYDRPLNIHVEWDPDTAQEVERLAASNRRARVVLSHCGCFATASDMRGVFERNANVACDLSDRGAPPNGARSAHQAVFDESSIVLKPIKISKKTNGPTNGTISVKGNVQADVYEDGEYIFRGEEKFSFKATIKVLGR